MMKQGEIKQDRETDKDRETD